MIKLTPEMSERLKIDFVLSAVEEHRVGSVVTLPMTLLMPNIAFRNREEFLQICETAKESRLRQTAYWKSRVTLGHSDAYIVQRVASYIKLLKNVRQRGIVTDPNRPRTYPIVFMHDGVYQRFDGAHRASIYRFLNHQTVDVWLVTAGEVLAKIDLPTDLREVLEEETQPWVYPHEYV